MEYESIRTLLKEIGSPKHTQELSGEVESFLSSDAWNLVRAVGDHLVAQNLRGGKDGLEGYGRVQGINAFLDFFSWVKDYARALKEAPKAETPLQHTQPTSVEKAGGYGVV